MSEYKIHIDLAGSSRSTSVFTVGRYDAHGIWEPESEHDQEYEALNRAAFLNSKAPSEPVLLPEGTKWHIIGNSIAEGEGWLPDGPPAQNIAHVNGYGWSREQRRRHLLLIAAAPETARKLAEAKAKIAELENMRTAALEIARRGPAYPEWQSLLRVLESLAATETDRT